MHANMTCPLRHQTYRKQFLTIGLLRRLIKRVLTANPSNRLGQWTEIHG